MTAATETPSQTTDEVPAPAALRPVRLTDLGNLELLEKECHGGDGFRHFILRQLYDLFNTQWIVAERAGVICGYVLVGVGTDGRGPRTLRLVVAVNDGCRSDLEQKANELCQALRASPAGHRKVTVAIVDRGFVRQAEEKDLADLEVLDNKVFITVGYSSEIFRMFFDLFREMFFVVEREGRICGYSLSGIDTDGVTTWLLGLAVDAEHQGRGFGRMLMVQSLAASRSARAREAKITVRPKNQAANNLYKRFGFRYHASERNYFGPEEDRKVLCLLLGKAARKSPQRLRA